MTQPRTPSSEEPGYGHMSVFVVGYTCMAADMDYLQTDIPSNYLQYAKGVSQPAGEGGGGGGGGGGGVLDEQS